MDARGPFCSSRQRSETSDAKRCGCTGKMLWGWILHSVRHGGKRRLATPFWL